MYDKIFRTSIILLLTTILVICIPFSQSWQTSHCDCDPVTNNELCDPICEGTCAAPRLCPPWLQGQWKSAKNWELTVVGDHVSAVILTQPFSGTLRCGLNLSKATTALNVGREWDILSQEESSDDLNVAIEWDVMPDSPTWMSETYPFIRGVIRLGRTNLQTLPTIAAESISSRTSSSIDVLITYGWQASCYVDGQQDTRYPSFSTLKLTSYDDGKENVLSGKYYYDSLGCTSTALSDICPHWLHGSWNGSMASIHETGVYLDNWIFDYSG